MSVGMLWVAALGVFATLSFVAFIFIRRDAQKSIEIAQKNEALRAAERVKEIQYETSKQNRSVRNDFLRDRLQ